MSTTPDSALADPQQIIADLQRANAELQRRLDERTAERDEYKTERDEALDREAATAEVLGVINASPGDLAPVFDAMLEKAMRLCEASFGSLWTLDGDRFRPAADHGLPPRYAEYLASEVPAAGAGTGRARLLAGAPFAHIADLADEEPYRTGEPHRRALVDLGGARTALLVPLRRDAAVSGFIMIYRQEVRPFTEKQVTLLQNFAAQAVIAMENARLITETREALEQQTATAEVLQVINSSPGDLTPVFDAMLERAVRLCEFDFSSLWTFDGAAFHPVARHRVPERFWQYLQDHTPPAFARTLAGERLVHIPDVRGVPAFMETDFALGLLKIGLEPPRSLLIVPLSKDDVLLGVIVAYRREVGPFSEKQIALLQNFAAQAVIAMENARLITETREALEQQTATAEVLGVINASPGDLAPVFDAMLEKAVRLCEASGGALRSYDGSAFHLAAMRGLPVAFAEATREVRPHPSSALGRIEHGEHVVHIADLTDPSLPLAGSQRRHQVLDIGGIRSGLWVALRKDDVLLGSFVLTRHEVRPFTDKQIALVESFAAQAVIAMENARLITETREARDDAETALKDLKAAQANLIQAEKMASLGQLTAGIAHEIKNPLNFVNNFASLSNELLDELKDEAEPALATLADDKRAEIDETLVMLSGNLEKIAEHGKRADNIVKSMLEHSRGVSGERREVDLNNLIEEALNLAYHGARAQNQDFNITLERDYAKGLKPIELAPQEITRVFLNLFGNGFYAANKRAHANGDGTFHPALTVATRETEDAVEVRVRDNGTGIAPEIRAKLFQPFFTTKPTGEGTGLGLSISYDIVTQQHGGTIAVDSEPGSFTEFTIRLPRQ